jgi:hypothetical protein
LNGILFSNRSVCALIPTGNKHAAGPACWPDLCPQPKEVAKTVQTYLKKAVEIIIANRATLLFPFVVFMGSYLPLLGSTGTYAGTYFLSSTMLVLIVCPLVYGRFAEIVLHREHVSWLDIFQSHWLNYFLVTLIFLLPVFVVSILIDASGNMGVLMAATINICAIYVFPLVFLKRERLNSISTGIKCLFGNLQFNMPLMALTLAVFLLGMLAEPPTTSPLALFISFGIGIATFVADLVIFVAASLILKDKVL